MPYPEHGHGPCKYRRFRGRWPSRGRCCDGGRGPRAVGSRAGPDAPAAALQRERAAAAHPSHNAPTTTLQREQAAAAHPSHNAPSAALRREWVVVVRLEPVAQLVTANSDCGSRQQYAPHATGSPHHHDPDPDPDPPTGTTSRRTRKRPPTLTW
ncbi:hypothetical protein GCM10010251_29370 [Streptomyces aurantiogriseus]|uniref:Uncharacterized protein n=1 Tax=Streptomyces aurantiogriseus TaxID=66870 RepID=A0A918C7W5_9ACTN|nr:hypothetical protein GCM10010251_29370 [Streptomyces aurantiogriseus]